MNLRRPISHCLGQSTVLRHSVVPFDTGVQLIQEEKRTGLSVVWTPFSRTVTYDDSLVRESCGSSVSNKKIKVVGEDSDRV